MNDTTTIGVPRRAVSFAAAAGLALAGTITIASGSQGAPTQTDGEKKVYVCKYVGKPGVDERLQTGQNPIQVSVNAIPGPGPVQPGYEFADAQGRSLVIAFVVDKKAEEPAPECPAAPPPTTTKPPTTTTTTTTTKPPTTTTKPPTSTTTTKTHPHKPKPPAKPKPKPPAKGGGVTPGVSAPDTGGAGGTSPANGLIGSGLLLAAAGVLGNDLLKRRREATNTK